MWHISQNPQQLWQHMHKYPILAQCQRIFYVHHQTTMMADQRTQHEQNPLIIYITTNIQNVWNNLHKCYMLAECQVIFYMHQARIVVDYCTKYEKKSTLSFLRRNNKCITFMKNTPIITQIWHGAKCYFTCIRST